MINHFMISLFNQPGETPDNVLNPLTAPLVESGALRQALVVWRGESAWDFAVTCTKVVDASTFQSALTQFDPRVTYDLSRLSMSRENAASLIEMLTKTQPAAATQVLHNREELLQVYRRSDLPQEAAAALLVGVVEWLTENNRG